MRGLTRVGRTFRKVYARPDARFGHVQPVDEVGPAQMAPRTAQHPAESGTVARMRGQTDVRWTHDRPVRRSDASS